MKRLVVIKASRMKWVWLLLESNSFNKWNLWQIWDVGVDLGVMNYGIGHMSGMCLMWLWVKWLWPCLDDLGTGGVSSFTLWLHRWWAFNQPHGAPTALLPRALWCLYEGPLCAKSGEVSHWGEGSGVSSGCISRAGGECCYTTAVRFIHINLSVHSVDRQHKNTMIRHCWLQNSQ